MRVLLLAILFVLSDSHSAELCRGSFVPMTIPMNETLREKLKLVRQDFLARVPSKYSAVEFLPKGHTVEFFGRIFEIVAPLGAGGEGQAYVVTDGTTNFTLKIFTGRTSKASIQRLRALRSLGIHTPEIIAQQSGPLGDMALMDLSNAIPFLFVVSSQRLSESEVNLFESTFSQELGSFPTPWRIPPSQFNTVLDLDTSKLAVVDAL